MRHVIGTMAALSLVALVGCTPKATEPDFPDAGDETSDAGEELDGPELLGGLDCDPLSPTTCGYPFPSNVYLVDDPSTPTGKRVRFGKTTLPMYYGFRHMKTAPFETRDGFSQSGYLLAHLPGATTQGLANEDSLALSLADDSPTVLIEADTGRRIPHIAELDMLYDDDADRALIIRSVERLEDATRYIVAIREVKSASGAIPPSPAFKALRDEEATETPAIERRRALYADIFAKLQAAGVERGNLQLAWDFTTASKENTTGWLVHMREKALEAVGETGPEFSITTVTENPNGHIRRRIEGTFRVPLFLTQAGITFENDRPHVGRLVFDAEGLPRQNGWADYPFIVQIPNSVAEDPGQPILQQGHGLLGRRTEGRDGYFARLANEKKYVTMAVDLIGMANEDEKAIQGWITADMADFQGSVDRQHQGHINQLLAMRLMMSEAFRTDENLMFDGVSAIDPTRRYYRGDSQGGIMGAVYMALSKDVELGYLGEPGMPYNLLLTRSVDFDEFLMVLKPTYATARNLHLVLGLLQMLWDRTEPTGWVPYITGNTVSEDTPAKRLLLGAALGDYQVTPLGAHMMARAVGAVHLVPGIREIHGLEEATGPLSSGSAYQEFDFGLPKAPVTNTPPRPPEFPEGKDPHDEVRELPAVFDATDEFFRDGIIRNHCEGACFIETP